MPNNQSFNTSSTTDMRNPHIKVIGLGGAGCNTIQHLSRMKIPQIELIAANTDLQALARCQVDAKLLLGKNLTGGLGTGGNPRIGMSAAEESYRELIHIIQGTDLLFLTAGMGGGTGSGAIQIAARMARSLDIPTIGIVTLPFSFESGQRSRNAAEAASCLRPFLDTLITIPNDRLLTTCKQDMRLDEALAFADDILIQGILGISGLIQNQGLLNIDLSHVLRLMRAHGGTYIATTRSAKPHKIVHAIRDALRHPLLEGIIIRDAKGIIIKFSGDVSIVDITHGLDYLKSLTSEETEIITAVDDRNPKSEEIKIMLLVTGIGAQALAIEHMVEHNRLREEKDIFNKQEGSLMNADSTPNITNGDDLAIPAFIRKGYNLLNTGITSHAATDT